MRPIAAHVLNNPFSMKNVMLKSDCWSGRQLMEN
jgi:hypothetical protein